MVKVAISGGSCEIARTIIDLLLATKKYEIIILSRRGPKPTDRLQPETIRRKVDYQDKKSLVAALQGVHTVLCFIPAHLDPEVRAQKNLIDAAVEAGAKRFAPSEWSVSDPSVVPWHASKSIIREYLAHLNKDKTVLEYTLFQPGLLLDHLALPSRAAPYYAELSISTIIDIPNRRAILPEGGDDRVVLTSMRDVAATVTRAVSNSGPWPVQGGIRGNLVSLAEVISLAERLCGGHPFHVERLKPEELQKEAAQEGWGSGLAQAHKALQTCILLAITQGAFVAGDEWNIELANSPPGPHTFQTVEEFLKQMSIKRGKQLAEGGDREEGQEMEGIEFESTSESGNLA